MNTPAASTSAAATSSLDWLWLHFSQGGHFRRRRFSPSRRTDWPRVEAARRGAPGIRIVVSYADPQQGHYGGIYQAGNWTYLGAGGGRNVWRRRGGKIVHDRRVTPSGWAKRAGIWERVIRQDECQKIVIPAKHKYAFALDKSLRPLLASMAKPYPEKGAAA